MVKHDKLILIEKLRGCEEDLIKCNKNLEQEMIKNKLNENTIISIASTVNINIELQKRLKELETYLNDEKIR